MFKVGQRVYDILYEQWGVVQRIDGSNYPVCVEFDVGSKPTSSIYTTDGRSHSSFKLRTLYWGVPIISGGTEPPFESKLVGKIVVMYHGHNHGPVIGKVTAETENLLTIAGRPGSLHKSGIITMYELGDQIRD